MDQTNISSETQELIISLEKIKEWIIKNVKKEGNKEIGKSSM